MGPSYADTETRRYYVGRVYLDQYREWILHRSLHDRLENHAGVGCSQPYMGLVPHILPLWCWVDASYHMPPLNSVLRLLPWQSTLQQVVPGVIQPHSLWSTSPSFPRNLHRHDSLAHTFVVSFQYMPIPLHPAFLYFVVPLFFDPTHPS